MNMNQEQFEQAIREKKPVLVDFWAPWCKPCREVTAHLQLRLREGALEQLADQLRHRPPAAAVRHVDAAVLEVHRADVAPAHGVHIDESLRRREIKASA